MNDSIFFRTMVFVVALLSGAVSADARLPVRSAFGIGETGMYAGPSREGRLVILAQGTEREKGWDWYGDNYSRPPRAKERPDPPPYTDPDPGVRGSAQGSGYNADDRPWGSVPQAYQREPRRSSPYGASPGWEGSSREGYASSPYDPQGRRGDFYRREEYSGSGGYYSSPDRDPGYWEDRRGRYDDREREWSPPPARGYEDRYGSGPGREGSYWGHGGNYGRNPNGEYPEYPGYDMGPGSSGGWSDPFRWGRW
ncbi:MAG: hypothetical protein HQL63_07205 [Magnetococcales bacterium]|nr:hypothetical protein [Magnetococcales bacterium]